MQEWEFIKSFFEFEICRAEERAVLELAFLDRKWTLLFSSFFLFCCFALSLVNGNLRGLKKGVTFFGAEGILDF